MQTIPVILGPTSSGKTSLAIDVCKKLDAEIISADSRQVVKYMNSGTGKIPSSRNIKVEKSESKWILDGVTIWGYDMVDPNEFFSAYDFAKFAIEKIQRLTKEGKKVIVVGGTGFYIDVLTGRVKLDSSTPNFEIRNELEALSVEQLRNRLKELNEGKLTGIDQSNPVRLIRAIENELSDCAVTEPLKFPVGIKYELFGLTAENKLLFSRVDSWLDQVWLDTCTETEFLINNGYSASHRLKGLIYKSINAYLSGELSEEEAKQRAKFDLHAYIRRQKTYFKKNPEVRWFDISDDNHKEKLYNLLESYE